MRDYIVEGASDNSVIRIGRSSGRQSVARLVDYQFPFLAPDSNNEKSDIYAVKRIRVARD